MQVVTNQSLVQKRARFGLTLNFVALGIFAVGLYLSFQPTLFADAFIVSYGTIIVGLLVYNFGQFFIRRYGPTYRQDGALQQALKGLDARFTLYNFLSSKLPDHLLVGPGGIQVLVPRRQSGIITCNRDRWSTPRGPLGVIGSLFGNSLGNPSQEANQGLASLREQFRRRKPAGIDAEDLPAQALIVFTSDDVKLQLNGCSHPATTAREFRGVVRRQREKLPPRRVEELKAALGELKE